MTCYQDEICWLLTRRTGDWLSSRSWPRTTAASALTLAVSSAVCSSQILVCLGVEDTALRFAASTVCGYVVFLLMLAVWLRRFSPIDAKSLMLNNSRTNKTHIPGESTFDDSLDDAVHEAIRQTGRHTNGLLGLLILIGIFGFLFLACHFIYHAPWYLGQLLVNSGTIRHRAAPKGNSFDFLVLPLQFSWPFAVMVLIHSATVGLAFQILNANNPIFR